MPNYIPRWAGISIYSLVSFEVRYCAFLYTNFLGQEEANLKSEFESIFMNLRAHQILTYTHLR